MCFPQALGEGTAGGGGGGGEDDFLGTMKSMKEAVSSFDMEVRATNFTGDVCHFLLKLVM